jgi:ureidoglycolate dehydrogenase (NAD+)
MIDDDAPTLAGASVQQAVDDARGRVAGVIVLALSPAAFGDTDAYARLVGETLAAAKRVPPAAGIDEIVLPGEPERRARARRSVDGVSLADTTWQDLALLADRFAVPLPPHSTVDQAPG